MGWYQVVETSWPLSVKVDDAGHFFGKSPTVVFREATGEVCWGMLQPSGVVTLWPYFPDESWNKVEADA
jgi:hypothetical protein